MSPLRVIGIVAAVLLLLLAVMTFLAAVPLFSSGKVEPATPADVLHIW